MLKLLHIENIAVIERCDIEFKNGFNVLTGETGAGKSIIIDAIGAALGYRTTRDVVRNGAEKASVVAVFENLSPDARTWLSENELDSENKEEVFIQRDISSDGKSTARINGKPVTASTLKNLGILLVNVLGQHDSQQLLNPELHGEFIDKYSSSPEFEKIKCEYKETYERLKETLSARKKLDMDEAEKARRTEMLRFQIEDIESADLKENEDEILSERRKIILESSKISEKIAFAHAAFSGDGEFSGITSALASVSKELSAIADISDALTKLSEAVSDAYYSSEDILGELGNLSENLDFSPEEANEIEIRLDTIHKLKRKYGSNVSEILQYLENAKKELSEIEFSEEKAEELDREIAALKKRALELADSLSVIRDKNSRKFESRITAELSELYMPNAKFSVKNVRTEELNENGNDSIEFFIATNLGENEKPLERIASGGELSRIMLALKNTLDESDSVNTLIFDEIDTGVSGLAAQKIAEKLYGLSVNKQVLCVTHLAQLSAMADTHFKIEKSEHDGRTFTNVTELDFSGRAEELIRITGGTASSKISVENSKEMLSRADEIKHKIKKEK